MMTQEKRGFLFWQDNPGGMFSVAAREVLAELCPDGVAQIPCVGINRAGTLGWNGNTLIPSRCRFDESRQTWEPHPRCSGLWIGYWDDLRPEPSDFARPHEVCSIPVAIEGTVWRLPVLYRVTGENLFPQKHVYRERDGVISAEPETLPQYRVLEADLDQFRASVYLPMLNGEKPNVEASKRVLDLVISLVRLTHYFDVGLLNLLGSLTVENNGISIIIGTALGFADYDTAEAQERTPLVEV